MSETHGFIPAPVKQKKPSGKASEQFAAAEYLA